MSIAPIGIFGGTFDPIHFGHLRLAQEIAEFIHMAQVRFVPGGTPPHRAAPQVTSLQRLEMTLLATADNELFLVDDREVKRSGPGFTVDTLTELRREVGADRPLCLMLGADAFIELATWHRWHEIFSLAHIVVAHRPRFAPETWPQRMPEPLVREYTKRLLRQPYAVHLSPAGGIATQAIAALDISGSMIRESLARSVSPRYLLPDPVLDYIRKHNLYVTQEVNEDR
jgi:nicotinate-nucleotide adenylyltransferase